MPWVNLPREKKKKKKKKKKKGRTCSNQMVRGVNGRKNQCKRWNSGGGIWKKKERKKDGKKERKKERNDNIW